MVPEKKWLFFLITILCFEFGPILGQVADTLPNYQLVKRNGKIFISWTNPYRKISQLTIQRSPDSVKSHFKSIVTMPDPNSKENGYFDRTASNDQGYYRLFIQLEGINYYYTAIKKPIADTFQIATPPPVTFSSTAATHPQHSPASISVNIPDGSAPQFKDSISTNPTEYTAEIVLTGETMASVNRIRAMPSIQPIKIKIARIQPLKLESPSYPSRYIFTSKEGQVILKLPETPNAKNYSIHFYNEKAQPVFEINQITGKKLIIDKVNFLSTGWFYFKLMEDGKFREVNKVFITN